MKSERVSLWLSLLANVGLLVGLILLVVELRHNTLATQAVLHQGINDYGRDHIELLVSDENEKLAEIVFRGESDPDSLSEIEFQKFILFTAWRMGAWEMTFLHYDQGLVEERNWKLTNRIIRPTARNGNGKTAGDSDVEPGVPGVRAESAGRNARKVSGCKDLGEQKPSYRPSPTIGSGGHLRGMRLVVSVVSFIGCLCALRRYRS